MYNSQNRADVLRLSYKELGGEFKLSRHFKLKEAQSRDGADLVVVHPASICLAQALRDKLGERYADVSIKVNRWYSTPEHNASLVRADGGIGGAKDSVHMWGGALDIVCYTGNKKIDPKDVARVARELGAGGVKAYKNFAHVDVWHVRTW